MASNFLKSAAFLSVMAAVFLLAPASQTKASSAENIRGWAYNSTYGYVSFNCLDDGFAGRFPFTFPFTFNIAPCAYNQHGVNLGADNNFSGNAWNSVLGFITFNSTSTPPDTSYRAYCENTCDSSNSCTACYRESDESVYGYMRVVSTGEWIKLDNHNVSPSVSITNYQAPQPGIFSGYATTTFGTISFNCQDDGVCGTNNYQVKIGPLEIRQLIAPNWNALSACSIAANRAVLKWNRRSGTQSAYQVIVSTANSTSTGVIADSGKVSNSATQFSLSTAYNTSYYWFLRLWDDADVATPWRQFNLSGTKDWISDNYSENLAKSPNPNLTFTTYKHEFPRSLFTWTPNEIVIATTTNSFVSGSSYYDNANNQISCGSTGCKFNWTTSDARANILAPTKATTSIMFTKATNTSVTLVTTDNDNYSCATSTVLNVNYALPLWKEIKPTN